jgi:hypothetical protein
MCDKKMLSASKISIADLGGSTKTRRGHLDLLMFKLELLQSLLHKSTDDCQLSKTNKQLIRTKMSDFASFEAAKESAWQALLEPSGKKFAELVEVPTRSCEWPSDCQSLLLRCSHPITPICDEMTP